MFWIFNSFWAALHTLEDFYYVKQDNHRGGPTCSVYSSLWQNTMSPSWSECWVATWWRIFTELSHKGVRRLGMREIRRQNLTREWRSVHTDGCTRTVYKIFWGVGWVIRTCTCWSSLEPGFHSYIGALVPGSASKGPQPRAQRRLDIMSYICICIQVAATDTYIFCGLGGNPPSGGHASDMSLDVCV